MLTPSCAGWSSRVFVRFWSLLSVGFVVSAACLAKSVSIAVPSGGSTVRVSAKSPDSDFHPARLLVRFRNGARHDFLPGSGPMRSFPGDAELFLVAKPLGLSVAQTVRSYRANPNVLYAEPDYVVRTAELPTDPRWNEQWDMTRIACPAGWDTQKDASGVIVAVIDTGIDFTHPDLRANLWINPADATHGFTCMNGVCAAGGADDHGHGTHVAGTIGAVANDGIGIAGINWKVQLLAMKFLDSGGGGQISDAILAFDKLTALKQLGFNIRVTNNSWGGGGYSQALKDSMARAEAAGVLHVCAAGNSGQNADVYPMYPAAYENRGIVSVLASDANDAGAGFTNYGLFTADIAAPGVATLSTVPTGACALCDASGYKALSGTSMATPHVSGVLAALFQQNGNLTPAQARDVVLDPRSLDAVMDARAASSSTGGRVNLARALSNPLLFAPTLNDFPTLTMGGDVFATAGSVLDLSATASDANGDPLRMAWSRTTGPGSLWLFGWVLNSLLPDSTGNAVSFLAPALARDATVAYDVSVADGRGGGAHGREYVTISPGPSHGSPPSGGFTVSPTEAPAGSTISVTFNAIDPEGGPAASDLWIGQLNGASGGCCYESGSTTVRLDNPGVFRFSSQAIDPELNLSARPSTVVRIGGATGEPPIAAAVQDRTGGPVPLTVNLDMRGSSDPDGVITQYFFDCGSGERMASSGPFGACHYDKPGTYWILLQVQDNAGYFDVASAYAVATPLPSSADTRPPTVSITSPAAGAHVSGNVSLVANATDDLAVTQVSFFLDSSTAIGSRSTPPWTFTWDSSTVSAGAHSISAIARDAAGNSGSSASVPITVDATTTAQVSITSPANGTTVPRRSSVSIQASVVEGSFSTSRVDFLVDSAVACSDATAPYSCNWTVPAKPNRSYQLRANAYDTTGRVVTSSPVTVTAR
jgi:subtilisin family serine protease